MTKSQKSQKLKFETNTQLWLVVEGDVVVVGLKSIAKDAIGEIVYVQLPEIGKRYAENEEICILESAKSAFDLYAPIAGKVVEINKKLGLKIDLMNKDPEGQGWLYKMQIKDVNDLKKLKKC